MPPRWIAPMTATVPVEPTQRDDASRWACGAPRLPLEGMSRSVSPVSRVPAATLGESSAPSSTRCAV